MNSPWCTPALRGTLGDWVYYCALMSPKQISKRVKSSHEIRESKELEDFLQRTLKPRVAKIAQYLLKRNSRFFNSMIVGIFGGLPQWAALDLSTASTKLRIAEPDEMRETLGLLIFTGNEKMFAIDGQHRVGGINQAHQTDPDRIGEDQYPVIFVAHLDTKDGKVRTRRLFCDINKNAVAVSEGDKVVIDEDDLCAIVTRQIYATYPPFKRGREIAVTERKELLVRDNREYFTSLLAVYTVCKKLKRLYKKPRGTPENSPESVRDFRTIVHQFFDFALANEPSLNRYFRSRSTSLHRERENNKSLFFRPVGLEVLARLYSHFGSKDRLPALAQALRQLRLENPRGIFDGILWNDGRITASAKAKKAAVGICLYLLGELTRPQQEELTDTLRDVTRRPDYSLPEKQPPHNT